MSYKDFTQFIVQGLKPGSNLKAVAPSSESLAAEMVRHLDYRGGRVLELGPGTGVFTRALIAAGVPESHLDLLEMNEDFCTLLEKRFPEARIHKASAARIPDLELGVLDEVTSGLPILSFGHTTRYRILHGVFASLRPGGRYTQFTYGRKPPYPPAMLERLNLAWEKSDRVWNNLPPATVYRFYRTAEEVQAGLAA